MKLVFVGVGGGAPSRWGLPGILLKRDSFSAIFDCGEGTQIKIVEKGLGINVDLIAITHMHADHVLGVLGLVQTMGLLSRERELVVLGPSELKDFLEESFRRTKFRPNFDLVFRDSYETKEFRITRFPTCHTIESYGYVIEEKEKRNLDAERLRREGIRDFRVFRELKEGRAVEYNGRLLKPEDYVIVTRGKKVVYTGDTKPCEKVVEASRGADVLIHDSTFVYSEEAHEYGHSNVVDAVNDAVKAGVGTLVLYHYSARYDSVEPLLYEARRFFRRVVAPQPLDSLVIQ